MKNKYILSALLLLGTTTIGAQETYENTKLIDNDLNGTARYVGMGGALDALGADISVIGSNPAGLGLMTKSRAEVSFGFVSQPGVSAFQQGNPTNASFDQVGFVYVMRNPRGDNSGSSDRSSVRYQGSGDPYRPVKRREEGNLKRGPDLHPDHP